MSRLSIAALVSALAEKSSLTKEQVRSLLQAQAAVTYKHAAKGEKVPIPGIGVIETCKRPGRDMLVQAGPDRGKIIHLAGMQTLRIVVNEAAADVILKGGTPPPDVLKLNPFAGVRRRRADA